jgi:hypothetical protein
MTVKKKSLKIVVEKMEEVSGVFVTELLNGGR